MGAIVVISYLYWYCKKIKANPEASLHLRGSRALPHNCSTLSAATAAAHAEGFSLRKKAILVLFISAFVLMVYGVMNPSLVVPADGCHVPGHLDHHRSGTDEKTVVNAFINGASSLVGVSLIIGLARGINLDHGRGPDLRHGSLFWSSNAVQGMAGPAFILIMMLLFFLLGFVVPVFSSPYRFGNAHYGSPGRYGRHRSLLHRLRLSVGSVRVLYLAPYRPGLATLTMLDMKYSKWFKFVWPIGVHVGVRRYPSCARRSCSHNAANILL